jgi:hypothetical protein
MPSDTQLAPQERLDIIDAKIRGCKRQMYDNELDGRIARKLVNTESEAQAISNLKKLEEVLDILKGFREEIAGTLAETA